MVSSTGDFISSISLPFLLAYLLVFHYYKTTKLLSPSLSVPSDMAAAFASRGVPSLWFLLCFLCLLSGVNSDELQSLLVLKSAIQNSSSHVFDSWTTTNSPCKFNGVTCNSDGSVREIDLSNANLSGAPPFDSICQLRSLEKLSLGFNSLSGRVTEDLNNCVKLKYLDLGNNVFAGPVPDISSLRELQYLHLNNSGFSGTFPWKSLLNMTGLLQLSVGDNSFDPTPFPKEVLNLKNLNSLYLTNCTIEGEIPAGIGDLSELVSFEISDNSLTGSIPDEIGKLTNLMEFEIYNNSITGQIPSGFRNLTKLELFDASQNLLEGDLSELGSLKNLVTLQLFQNKFIGKIPVEFGEFTKLVNLSLYQNQLTGSVPEKIGSWTEFDYIDVSENFLTGPIPAFMCSKGTMRGLLMLNNNLTGEIPIIYGNCSTLRRFRVSNNSLSGPVPPGIWGLPKLEIIDIELNQLEGTITPDIQNAESLSEIYCRKNRLSGELPEEISKATSLSVIDLSENQFSSKIPEGIGELKELNSLHLQSNQFSGFIPDSLGSCTYLTDVNIAWNSLNGGIPSSLGSLPSLNALNLSHNEIFGQIPQSFKSLRLSLLDLSNNRLYGPIPEFLSMEVYNGSFAGNPGLCSIGFTGSFKSCSTTSSGMSKNVHTLIICFVLGVVLLLVLLTSLIFLKKEKQRQRSLKEESWNMNSFHVVNFTEAEIVNSINQENLIGTGGSGNVYRVQLPNGKDLAVKHIWKTDFHERRKSGSTTPMLGKRTGKSKEFDAEVQALSSIRHVNVVKLYSSITSEDSSLLVYEYLPNGSLWDKLHSSQKLELDWETRYEIALGAAKGLEYLHHGYERPVIHRDVKSSNILLDEFLKPRIADFGLAKIDHVNNGKDSTHVIAGTLGYIAPEYGYSRKVNEKSDVYSFGVVMMELVTGKRPIEPDFGENKDIVNWVFSNIKSIDSILNVVVDSRLSEAYKEQAVKVLRIAIVCTSRVPSLRPTMRTVVQMLEDAEPCKLVDIVISKDDGAKGMDMGVKEKA